MNAQKVISYIVEWLDGYIQASKLNGFVVGVSGGIDSAVTSTLCAETGHQVFALNMPIYQAHDQCSRSAGHIRWLENRYSNVKGHDVELTNVFKSLEETFPENIQDDLTMANTRSRLRMITLYAFASSGRMLVAGTGNKVEDFGVGFYTKYGDGGVDISPIADLMKTEVYDLGRELGIIRQILEAAPTDGLWDDNRTDESQIGAAYEELEWAMRYLESGRKEKLEKRQKEVLDIYSRFHTANLHKMKPIPVCRIPSDL